MISRINARAHILSRQDGFAIAKNMSCACTNVSSFNFLWLINISIANLRNSLDILQADIVVFILCKHMNALAPAGTLRLPSAPMFKEAAEG
jgi:hypothetical protein